MKYDINLNISGRNGREILEYLARHVSLLPDNATILEIGSLFGRTTLVFLVK
jgi:hypothetical protein